MFLLLSCEAPEHLLQVCLGAWQQLHSNIAAGHEALTGHPKLKPQGTMATRDTVLLV